jgi:hypothetical protein
LIGLCLCVDLGLVTDDWVGKPVQCFYCGNCTSHIYHHQAVMPDKIIVRTLLLEEGPGMPATGEIFGEGRLSWVTELREGLTNGTA